MTDGALTTPAPDTSQDAVAVKRFFSGSTFFGKSVLKKVLRTPEDTTGFEKVVTAGVTVQEVPGLDNELDVDVMCGNDNCITGGDTAASKLAVVTHVLSVTICQTTHFRNYWDITNKLNIT